MARASKSTGVTGMMAWELADAFCEAISTGQWTEPGPAKEQLGYDRIGCWLSSPNSVVRKGSSNFILEKSQNT
jgi:hypothetical protein